VQPWEEVFPNSSNLFSTASNPLGPWSPQLAGPWSARVAPVVLSIAGGTKVLLAGGMCMQLGVPEACSPEPVLATPGDVWLVDAGVCLLSGPSNTPCNGKADPDLDTVTCPCPFAWSGDALCASCGANVAGSSCNACAAGFWGPSCTACPPCGSHGSCSGAGTQGGTGTCICQQGWSGTSCNVPATSASASRSASRSASSSPAPAGGGGGGGGGANTTKAQPLSGGAAFGVSLLVILSAAAAAAFVFAKYYGGGPTLAKWGGQAWGFTVWAAGHAWVFIKWAAQGIADGVVALYSYFTSGPSGAPAAASKAPSGDAAPAVNERASLLRPKAAAGGAPQAPNPNFTGPGYTSL
jgi:hypothetical protein